MDIESALIKHYGGASAVPWNNSGFGSNDPGKERDTTTYKEDHWDTQYPIILDETFIELPTGVHSVSYIMLKLKDNLPYLLRYQKPSRSRNSFHEDFQHANLIITKPKMTSREILVAAISALPKGWHATAVPSHIIVYKDDTRKFPSGTLIAQS